MRRRLPAPATRRRLRRESGLTLQIVADELGVSHPTIARWELGERVPSGDHLPRYLALLDRLRAELVTRADANGHGSADDGPNTQQGPAGPRPRKGVHDALN